MLGITVPAYIQTMLYSVVFDKMEGVDHSAEAEREDDGWTVELEDGSEMPAAAESMQDVLASWENKKMTESEENDTNLGQNDAFLPEVSTARHKTVRANFSNNGHLPQDLYSNLQSTQFHR